MIRNDNQLTRTLRRLEELRNELQELSEEYSDYDLLFWSRPLEIQISKLQEEVDEYLALRSATLEEAVNVLLQKPVRLENIGELLTKLRIAAGYTQEELADKLGWQQSNLSRFESENYSSQTIGKISEHASKLGVWLHVRPSLTEHIPNLRFRKEADVEGRQRGNPFIAIRGIKFGSDPSLFTHATSDSDATVLDVSWDDDPTQTAHDTAGEISPLIDRLLVSA